MYLSKRQQEVLSMMSKRESHGDNGASLWSMEKGRTLHVSFEIAGTTLPSHVGYRTAYVLEGLGLIASCVDTDLTVGYRLTERGAALVELLSDGCGFNVTSAS